MGLWKIWPPAAHLAHAAVLNGGQALGALTSQRSAGKMKRWFQHTQVKSESAIPISFIICLEDQIGWAYRSCFKIRRPFTENSNDIHQSAPSEGSRIHLICLINRWTKYEGVYIGPSTLN